MLVGENPFSKIKARVTKNTRKAELKAAETLANESIKYVPIYSGRLRRSWRIEESDGVQIVFDTPYASEHYYTSVKSGKALRHVDMGDGRPGSVADVASVKNSKRLNRGRNTDSYGKLYKEAAEAGLLVTIFPDGQRWLQRAFDDEEVKAKISPKIIDEIFFQT